MIARIDEFDSHVLAYHVHIIQSNRAIKHLRALLAGMERVS